MDYLILFLFGCLMLFMSFQAFRGNFRGRINHKREEKNAKGRYMQTAIWTGLFGLSLVIISIYFYVTGQDLPKSSFIISNIMF